MAGESTIQERGPAEMDQEGPPCPECHRTMQMVTISVYKLGTKEFQYLDQEYYCSKCESKPSPNRFE